MQQPRPTPMDYSALPRHAPQLQPYHLTTLAPCGEQVRVALGNASTWRKFSRQNTEMIVTKVGRRMFPSLSLDIRGLDPVKKYEVYVTLMLADRHTLKYQRGVWLANGQGETYPPPGCSAGLVYVHPDSPAPGKHWIRQEVAFMRLKLTNKLDAFASEPARNGAMIFAYSMHKYLPVVHIRELPQRDGQQGFYTAVAFPGTEFITVTAYQNPELTDLKIQFNPYAKGIRNQGDRSGPLLIDSFRPTVQALQQQLQLPTHPTPSPTSQLPQPQPHQVFTSEPTVNFGAYPDQTDSAYGHWSGRDSASSASRRHRPYTVESSPMMFASSSAEGGAVPYSYPGQYLGYQPLQHLQHLQQHHQLYYQPAYYPGHEEMYTPPSHLQPVPYQQDLPVSTPAYGLATGPSDELSQLSTPQQQQQQQQKPQQQQMQHHQQCQVASSNGQATATDSSSLSAVSFSSPPTCDL